jgi:hypothetical protein
MSLRNFPTLAFVLLLAAACGDDDSKPNANQSGDGGPDSSVPTTTKRDAGAGGSRGGDTPATTPDQPEEPASGGKGGKGASGSGGAPAAGSPATAGRGGAGRGSSAGAGGTVPAGGEDDAGTLPVGGPYFTSGGLKGYVWLGQTGAGTSLRVTNYATAEFTAPVCIRGSVAATPDYSGNAMLGINLNQTVDGEPGLFTPTSAGLQVNLTNLGGSPLRIQIQTQDGATNGQGRWCAVVNGSGGVVPWTDFNTACWDGSGAAYARQPIVSVILLVPGTTDVAIPYDVCLNQLTQSSTPGDDADAGL